LISFHSAEYGVFWKCIQAGAIYLVTQLCKMLALATFFPASDIANIGRMETITVRFNLFILFLLIKNY
jgi:hypothetical protein